MPKRFPILRGITLIKAKCPGWLQKCCANGQARAACLPLVPGQREGLGYVRLGRAPGPHGGMVASHGHWVPPRSWLGTAPCGHHHPPAPSPAPANTISSGKMPPPSWSCVLCPLATKLPLCSLAPSAKCGLWEGAPRRPTLRSGIPLLPRSPSRAGAEQMSQPGDTLSGVQRGGCPKPMAPALPRQVSCRWAVNHLPAGDLHLPSG